MLPEHRKADEQIKIANYERLQSIARKSHTTQNSWMLWQPLTKMVNSTLE